MELNERIERAMTRAIEGEDFKNYKISACARELGLLSKAVSESEARAFVKSRFPDVKPRRFEMNFERGWRFGCENRFEDIDVDGQSISPPPVVQVQREPETLPEYRSKKVCASMWRKLSEPRESVRYLIEKRGWFFDSADSVFRRCLAKEISEGSESETFRFWHSRGNRMVVPLRDYDGFVRSFKGRFIGSGEPEMKSRLPKGPVAGLILDNRVESKNVIVVEGEMDFLLWASVEKPARVIGVFSGSIRKGFDGVIPKGSTIYIRTDNDKAGNRYARKILGAIKDRDDLVIAKREPTRFEDDEGFYVDRIKKLRGSEMKEENYLPRVGVI